MITINFIRTSRSTVVIFGGFVLTIVLTILVFDHFYSWGGKLRFVTSHPSQSASSSSPIEFYLRHVQNPKIKPDTKTYTPYGAFDTTLPDRAPIHTSLMGEDLCVIDLDNRKFNDSGQIFGSELMTWDRADSVHGLSLGLLNHWLYEAKIHGYKYYFVEINAPEDRRASWKKPHVISQILRNHEACIYLDSDAIFEHLDLPFEWLLNYWEIDSETSSLALAIDPDLDHNKDKFGKVNLNTGFIIAQNNLKTHRIMDAWQSCADYGGDHPDCIRFRTNLPGHPTDQGGFGTYIRYDFPDDIKELPCNEANGFPQSDSGCAGKFIRHLWTGKENHIKVAVGKQLPGDYLSIFHKAYLAETRKFLVTEDEVISAP